MRFPKRFTLAAKYLRMAHVELRADFIATGSAAAGSETHVQDSLTPGQRRQDHVGLRS